VTKSRTRHPNENHYTRQVTCTKCSTKHRNLTGFSSFNPTSTQLKAPRSVVNPRLPASPHVHLEAGLPRSLAEPTTTAHSPLLWQLHDVKTVKFACVLSAGFIFASATLVGRRMRKMGHKTHRLVELVRSRGSQPARSISWNSTAATTWTRCYIRNDGLK
jgi:hypothetical protein